MRYDASYGSIAYVIMIVLTAETSPGSIGTVGPELAAMARRTWETRD
jgi:hypothetical protein